MTSAQKQATQTTRIMHASDQIIHKKRPSALGLSMLLMMMMHTAAIPAQHASSSDSSTTGLLSTVAERTLLGGTFTNFGYGGPAIKCSRFNDQFAWMTGGRGAATINNRYTIGGGGYGIASAIRLPNPSPDTTRYFKMGYGGLELGYILCSGKKAALGTTLLIATGAAFSPGKPQSSSETLFGNEFTFLSVTEPSIYGELTLNKAMKLHAGLSYRYVIGSDLACMKVRDMNGFACYLALLFGKP